MAGPCDFTGRWANCLLPDCIAARWGLPTSGMVELSDDAKLGDCSSTSSGARLEVASALWGTEDSPVDVTEILAAMVEADELTIPKRLKFSKVFGDPAVRHPRVESIMEISEI